MSHDLYMNVYNKIIKAEKGELIELSPEEWQAFHNIQRMSTEETIELNKEEARAISQFLFNQWLDRDIPGLNEVASKISKFANE